MNRKAHKPVNNLISDDYENYQPPFTDLSYDEDKEDKSRKVTLDLNNYKWILHLEIKQLRAFKNCAVSKMTDFDRFCRNGLARDASAPSGKC